MQAKLSLSSLPSVLKRVPEGKPTYVWDTELAGFGLYVSAKGDVSYLVQRWLGGREGGAKRYVIGKQRDGMDIQDAKRLATTTIADLLNGREPEPLKAKNAARSVIQRQRQDKDAILTRDALTQYLALHPSTGRYRKEMEATLNRGLKPFLSSRLKSISKTDLSGVIEGYSEKPAAKRTLFAALRPFFNDCVAREIIPASPLSMIKTPRPVDSRDRTLTRSEIRVFWTASYHPSISPVWGSFYRLLLLTGQRREEVAGMRFEEIDFEGMTWTIPKERAKNKKAHIVHITPLMLEEINSSPRANIRTGYVFPAARVRKKSVVADEAREAHISGYSKMKTRLDAVMNLVGSKIEEAVDTYGKIKPFRLHDLRRTVASGMAEDGHSPDVIDRLLNHVSGSQSGVKGVYQRYQFLKEREEATKGWSERVSTMTKDLAEKNNSDFWQIPPSLHLNETII